MAAQRVAGRLETDAALDGYSGVAPADAYEPNGAGLYNMLGMCGGRRRGSQSRPGRCDARALSSCAILH